MNSQLERMAQEVEQLIENKHAEISIVVSTNYDELGLVGTPDAYLRLVKEVLVLLLASQKGELQKWKAGETEIQGSTEVSVLFDYTCEVHISCLGLVKTEQDTQSVSELFKQTSPPPD